MVSKFCGMVAVLFRTEAGGMKSVYNVTSNSARPSSFYYSFMDLYSYRGSQRPADPHPSKSNRYAPLPGPILAPLFS